MNPIMIPPVPKQGSRLDAPPVYNLRRGDKRVAAYVAQHDELLRAAEKSYKRDWVSAGDTGEYNLRTWEEMHAHYFKAKASHPDDLNTYPQTPVKFHGVGALMSVSGYRSAKNYISLAKKRHIELG